MRFNDRCADRLKRQMARVETLDLETIGRSSGFVRRQARKLDLRAFVKALLGLVGSGRLTLATVVKAMRLAGQPSYTPQALAKRVRWQGAQFVTAVLEALFQTQTARVCHPFNRILIQDSTTVALPDRYAPLFPGSVNQSARSLAQVKLQCIFVLDRLNLCHFSLSGFTRNDQSAAADILPVLQPNDLVVRDLGYFSVPILAQIQSHCAHFLSRFHLGTQLYQAQTGTLLDLPKRLKQTGTLDCHILVGETRFPARLVAVPVPSAVSNRRRRLARRARRWQPSKKTLALMSWNLFITSVPRATLSAKAICEVYRVRWTVEIIFKACKSHLRLENLNVHCESMLRLSILSRMLFCAMTLDLWSHLEWRHPPQRHASILRVARVLADCSALISCIVFRCSPSQLLDHFLNAHAFHPPRRDRMNLSERLQSLCPQN